MSYSKVSVLIIDDHLIVVDACKTLLNQNGFKSITATTICEEGLKLAIDNKPNLIIIDISMPGMGGLGIIRRIQKKNIDAKIIVFSMHDDPSIILRALEAGVNGYVSKTSSPEKILEAVLAVLSGDKYLSQDIAQTVALEKLNPKKNILDTLSPKEFEIFDMLVNGNNVSQIATSLLLNTKSVSNYITKIKAKLNTSSLGELVRVGYKYNIVKTESLV